MVAGSVFYTAVWIVSNNIPSSPLTQWKRTDAAPVFILRCNATIVMQDGCPKLAGWSGVEMVPVFYLMPLAFLST